jgi:beta,beta-carotene 9',10'-dioxygenase
MATATGRPDHRLGFVSQTNEIADQALEVSGALPPWLSGSLLRTGPALFEVGGRSLNHLFDGMAMLHRFTIADGDASYGCRFLRSKAFAAASGGQLSYREFATDPCRALYRDVVTSYEPAPPTDNGNIALARLGDRFIAMSEAPMPLEFDAVTLEVAGVAYEAPGYHCTAHPHYEPRNEELIGYATAMTGHIGYRIYAQPADGGDQRVLAYVPLDQPSYMHSFGMTENYFVLIHSPLVVDPHEVLHGGRPFIESYRWKPELGAAFLVIDRHSGELVNRVEVDPFFCFHQINAYEEDGEIVFDLCEFASDQVIESFYLERLRSGEPPSVLPFPIRYRIPTHGRTVSRQPLGELVLEMPQINYAERNGRPYRYVYGTGIATFVGWLDQLSKLDVTSGEVKTWQQAGSFPGEPVFVARPDGDSEDDGVLLSVTLDVDRGNSFLLVLDARDLLELARVDAPQHIPWHFHGLFAENAH